MKHMKSKMIVRAAFAGMMISVCQMSAALASDQTGRNTLYFDQPPSVNQLAQHLFPDQPRTRGLVIGPKPAAVKNTQQAELANNATDSSRADKTEKSIGLPVLFHFGKTTLVESSKPYLDQVGKLMQQSAYANETLIIEGHTDAVGSDESNYRLSELRALTVKDYLVTQYNIDPLRLFPAGKGESLLFDEANPRANVNRRVEFLRYKQ